MDLRRVFVGNLKLETDRNALKCLFETHGVIEEVSSHRNYVFFQYSNEESAKSAIESLHGSFFHGARLKVEYVTKFPRPLPPRDRSPLGLRRINMNPGGCVDVCYAQSGFFPTCFVRSNQSCVPKPSNCICNRSTMITCNPDGPCIPLISNNAESNPKPSTCAEIAPYDAKAVLENKSNSEYASAVRRFFHRGAAAKNPVPVPAEPPEEEKVNDIEVIVFERTEKDYGEYVEGRLKAMGFSVDILFPNTNALPNILGSLADKGSLYAVIILPEHKLKRSFNLLVLHGEPSEHQNIPLDDGLELIERNYESYKRAEMLKEKKNKYHVPKKIKLLLEIVLSEVQSLSVDNYDELIQYFVQQKFNEKQRQSTESNPSVQKHLTSRILNILDRSKNTTIVNSTLEPESSGISNSSFLNNQGVQNIPFLQNPEALQAINNLIQSSKIIDQIIRPNNKQS